MLLTLFASTAVAIASLQLLSHFGSGKILFGNARLFGIAIEGYTFWTTMLTAGTVSGLLINTLAGLIAWGLLEVGAAMFGGTRVIWSWNDVDLGNWKFGFSTKQIAPTLTLEVFASMIVSTFNTVKTGAMRLFNLVKTDSSVSAAA